MNDAIIRLIAETVGNANVGVGDFMSSHTTFKIGGAADLIVEPENKNQIAAILGMVRQFDIPCFVMGNGSNLLVGDKGIRGVVIKIANAMSSYEINGETIVAESGIKLSRLANAALGEGLAGLEFASGIPGTLGGAVYMNAGAYGGEMKDVIENVTYIDKKTLEIMTIPCSKCDFGYRRSVFSKSGDVICGATMRLFSDNPDDIKARMTELSAKRTEKQPVDKPSAGSTFKRPEGYFAGTMIQDCGLKGFKIGGAEVSQKHAGFVINSGGATAKDVLDLIEHIKKEVKNKYGVELEPEVKMVGEF